MKKIIAGKKYDTETAHCIDYWNNGMSGSDYVSAGMYRKKNGEYFVARQYGEPASDRFYTEKINPLSYDEAREWAETHLDADKYETQFGPVADDGETVPVTVRISKPAKAVLNKLAYGSSQSAVIERLLLGTKD
ncbi:MAG: hypothetical protein ACI362_04415 [Coriobacteriales bacterium]